MEVFGAVAGAISIAALFNNCVECFEYIELGRKFGRDYHHCQLKLDLAETRLSRWGAAVKINEDPRFAATESNEREVRLVQSVLKEIFDHFQSAYKKSQRYELNEDNKDALVALQKSELSPVASSLHKRLRKFNHQRIASSSLWKKTAWALHDGKALSGMIDQIIALENELQDLWPVEKVCRQLAELEIEEVEDEPSLKTLQDAAGENMDGIFKEVVDKKLEEVLGRNTANDIRAKDKAKVRVGDEISDAFLNAPNPVRGAANTVHDIDAADTSRVHVGNSFGNKSLMEDD